MGIVVRLRRHSRRSRRKKASIGTFPPESSLSFLAKPNDGSRRLAKRLRMCDAVHPTAPAISGTVIPFRAAQRSIGCVSDMGASISTRNTPSQPKLLPAEISADFNGLLQCRMGKSQKPASRPLFLGEWLDKFGVSQTVAAAQIGVEQSYIANLVSRKKDNPSALKLLVLSEFLGITVNDLYQMPPAETAITPIAKISPKAREALIENRRKRG